MARTRGGLALSGPGGWLGGAAGRLLGWGGAAAHCVCSRTDAPGREEKRQGGGKLVCRPGEALAPSHCVVCRFGPPPPPPPHTKRSVLGRGPSAHLASLLLPHKTWPPAANASVGWGGGVRRSGPPPPRWRKRVGGAVAPSRPRHSAETPPLFLFFSRPGPAAAPPRFSLLSQRARPPQPSHTNAPVCLPARRPGRPGRPRGRQQRGRGGPGFRVGRGSRARHPPAHRVQRHQACGVDGSKGGPAGGAGGRCVLSECGGEGEWGWVCGGTPPRLFLTLSLLSPILHTRPFPALPIQKIGPCGSKVREALVGRWWWWLWGWWALRALATNLSPSLPPAPHPLFLYIFSVPVQRDRQQRPPGRHAWGSGLGGRGRGPAGRGRNWWGARRVRGRGSAVRGVRVRARAKPAALSLPHRSPGERHGRRA